jgi:general secretion pathway protein J
MKWRQERDERRATSDASAPKKRKGVAASRRTSRVRCGAGAFTLIEVLIAMAILSLVVAAIYSSWAAILRASKVGLDAAAEAQRARIAMRVIEDSLGSAQLFVASGSNYAFVTENGSEASLSLAARLPKAFPRSGKFGDLDLRRVKFSVEPSSAFGRQLVLRQKPILMKEMDIDEENHPVVLAQDVREFRLEFWDLRTGDWIEEWVATNQLPKLVKVSLRLGAGSARGVEHEVRRVVGLPTAGVQPNWQVPPLPGAPGQARTDQLPVRELQPTPIRPPRTRSTPEGQQFTVPIPTAPQRPR